MSNHNDAVYLPAMRLVSFEEKVELLTEELLGLSSESREVLLEIIRLTWHIEQGIDKRRLLSDAPTGRGNTDNPPGDTRMAGLLINLQRHLKRLAARKRKQQERMIGDLWKVVNDFLKQMDKIEGHNDPERVRERWAKKAEKEESVTV